MGGKIRGALSTTQRATLRLLANGQSIEEISENRGTTQENTYQILRRLHAKGLVTLIPVATRYRLTPRGEEEIKRLFQNPR